MPGRPSVVCLKANGYKAPMHDPLDSPYDKKDSPTMEPINVRVRRRPLQPRARSAPTAEQRTAHRANPA